MSSYYKKQFNRWLDRRIPPQHDISLNQRRLFIFPSIQGGYFLLVILLLLIAAINYQNNLAYMLSFFLASIFNTSILFTYLNLSDLRLTAGKSQHAFAGEYAEFEIQLSRLPKKMHHRLRLLWPDNPLQECDLVSLDTYNISVYCLTDKRGIFRPGRLLLQSYYPLGIIRCWTWLDLGFETVVYPKPIALTVLPQSSVIGSVGRESPVLGNEDFYGFRDYAKGDSLRQVNWRGLAKGQPLQTKVYAAQQDESTWVDWDALPSYSTEERLSRLCGWILQLEQKDKPYGLRLPGIEISVDLGDKHRKKALTALALYKASANVE